jgi:hypothetical protein
MPTTETPAPVDQERTTVTSTSREGRAFRMVARTPIAAPASLVWNSVADLASYATWNPFVVEATGDLAEGARLVVRIRPIDGKPQTLRPTVTEVESGRTFAWLGHLGVGGLFDGAHRFTVTPAGPDSCELVQEERFTGVLVPLFRRWLVRRTLPGFVAMNEAVRARTEGRPPTA